MPQLLNAARGASRLVAALAALAVLPALAGVVSQHITDGAFGVGEWSAQDKHFFPVVGTGPTAAGGAYLYVAQQGSNLFLMYDYINSPNTMPGGIPMNSFFDVFFQVPIDHHDYVLRMAKNDINNSFTAFEKPIGTVSSLTPDGSFNLLDPVWVALSQADLQLAQFKAVIGFGASPDSVTQHLMAEFQLSVDHSGTQGPHGIYSPEPAFWSASVGRKNAGDPPISSAIFTLNPDGSTTVVPVFGPNGAPAQQPQDVPEPGSLWLVLAAAILALPAGRKARRA